MGCCRCEWWIGGGGIVLIVDGIGIILPCE